MISFNDEWLAKKIRSPPFDSCNQGQELLFISREVQAFALQSLAVEGYRPYPCIRTASIPTPEASHSITKGLEKSGKAKTRGFITKALRC